jgi:hypothetical protein
MSISNRFSSLNTLLCLWTGRAIPDAMEYGNSRHSAFIFFGAFATYFLLIGNLFYSCALAFLVAGFFAGKKLGRTSDGFLWGALACFWSWGFFPFGVWQHFSASVNPNDSTLTFWIIMTLNALLLKASIDHTIKSASDSADVRVPSTLDKVVRVDKESLEAVVWGPVIARFNDGPVHAWVETGGVRYVFDRVSRQKVVVLSHAEVAYPPGVIYSSEASPCEVPS